MSLAAAPRCKESRRGQQPRQSSPGSRVRGARVGYCAGVTTPAPSGSPRVFISYAADDHALALRIRQALAQSGIQVASPTGDVPGGTAWPADLRDALRTSDVVVALVTPTSVTSNWVSAEVEFALSDNLARRGVDLIPVLAAPMELPPALTDRAPVDLTGNLDAGLRQLADQIRATVRADFSAIGPGEFEALVVELLGVLGFDLASGEAGLDVMATSGPTDRWGASTPQRWLVEAKLYRHKRFSVEAIKKVVSRLPSEETGALLVTSARLTSVAQEYIAELAQ